MSRPVQNRLPAVTAPATASGAVYDDSTGQFRMWVPDDQPVVYGFYVSYDSSGDDNRTLAERASWQGFAQTFGFALPADAHRVLY